MSVAKGKFFISKEQLGELVGLPEGVEILAVKAKEFEDGFEFLIVSPEKVDGVTVENTPIGQIRRTSYNSLQERKNQEKIPELPFATGGFVDASDSLLVFDNDGFSIKSNADFSKIFDFDSTPTPQKNHTININIENFTKQDEVDVHKLFENIINGLKDKGKFQ